jgi:ceroid-lipofuscinosis MFS transporter 7
MWLYSLPFSLSFQLDPTVGKEFMGYVVGANPFGQMIFSPLVGWWGNRLGSIRLPLLFSLTVFTLSSACYSMLEIFPIYRKYWMLGARFFVGVSSGLCLLFSILTQISHIEIM